MFYAWATCVAQVSPLYFALCTIVTALINPTSDTWHIFSLCPSNRANKKQARGEELLGWLAS